MDSRPAVGPPIVEAHAAPISLASSEPAAWAVGVVLIVGLVVAHILQPDGVAGQSTYLAVTGGAAAAATLGARRQTAEWRFPWRCVAMGLTLSAIGDSILLVYTLFGHLVPEVSAADSFWLGSYVALVIGLSSLVIGDGGWRRVDIDGLTDIGSYAVLILLAMTQFSAVGDIISDASRSVLTRLIWTAYPVLDAALLGVVVQTMVKRRLRGRNGLLLCSGVVLWLIADFVTLTMTDINTIFPWLDAGFMLGAVGLAAATWPRDTARPPEKVARPSARLTDTRILVTLLPLPVPGIVEMWEQVHGRDPNPVPLLLATVVLVCLAYVRSTRLVKGRNVQTQALENSQRFYAALAENASDAVIVVDKDGRILNDAPNLATMLGRAGTSTIGVDATQLLLPLDRDAGKSMLERWFSMVGAVTEAELRATNRDGTDRWFGIRASNLSNDPAVGGMVVNLHDITDRKRAEDELSHKAFHDSLTGLANRGLFRDRLEHALERTSRRGTEVAVVYLDLDGFKVINDSRGHEAGDQVLREAAARLTRTVRNVDTVSRHGGDEFAILIEDSTRALGEAKAVADRVLACLTTPFTVHSQEVVLSASIGITVGDIGCTASSMMRDADLAMYKAKTTGKGRWAVYEPAMRTAALERLELESDLRQALDKEQLRLVYQPVIDLRSNTVVGFEALLRWDHPRIGLVGPGTFIPIAESNGMIVSIGHWVLEEACRTAAEWHRSFPELPQTMAVNLSACQIATPEVVGHVAGALEHSGFAAESLILEMTESVLVQDADAAGHRLEQLRALGVRLAIDDFGTGYSSLSYLRQFPIDILKIDRSFTQTITDHSPMPAIVRGLLDLAKTLGMETIAEGIELSVQLDNLRDGNCDFGQGMLIAEPLDLVAATAMIAAARRGLLTLAGTI